MEKRTQLKGEKGFFVILAMVSLFLFAVSLKMFISAPKLSGEGTMPAICCLAMIVTTGISLLEIRGYPKAFDKGVPLLTKAKEVFQYLFPGKVGIIVVYCLVYGITLNFLGFAISTLLFLIASMLTLNSEKKVRTVVICVITTACILVVFQYLFQVQLPKGGF